MKRKNIIAILMMPALLFGMAGLMYHAVYAAGENSIAAISAGRSHTLALKSDGSLWAWGDNFNGQLGNGESGNGPDGKSKSSSEPIMVGTDTNWAAISAASFPTGEPYSLALKKDGSLWAWGNNSSGQLGDGTTVLKSVPVKIGTGMDWKTIAAGGSHALALKKDGSLWAWGNNSSGQIGNNGVTTRELTPVRIGTETNWTAISAGDYHSLALKSDGSLWAWGRNSYGQLGDGTTDNRKIPVIIGENTGYWTAVSAGADYTLALKSNGSLWAWGANYFGQLGNGNTSTRYTPGQVGTETGWTTISAGGYHALALKSNGSLWAWGYNSSGQLGNGNTSTRYTPSQVGTETDWSVISAGGDYTVALKKNGTPWAWGNNLYGQFGNGTKDNSSTPGSTWPGVSWEPMPATVTDVIVYPCDATVEKGETCQFSVTVSGTGNFDPSVTWKLEDGSESTPPSKINQSGLLSVTADETAETLTITVTSATNPSISGTATVTVADKVILIGIELIDIKVTTPPNKTIYESGENLDLDGMVVTAIYRDSYTGDEFTDDIYTDTDPGNGDILNTIGRQLVTVRYFDKTDSFNVIVTDHDVDLIDIKVTKSPTKLGYAIGERLDLKDIVVTATFSNGDELEFDGFTTDPAEGDPLTEAGLNTVNVMYGEKTWDNFNVIVGYPDPDGDGKIKLPPGTEIEFPGGTGVELPDGAEIGEDGSITIPAGGSGKVKIPGDNGDTEIELPGGTVILPDGSIILPKDEEARITTPDGIEIWVSGDLKIEPDGSITLLPGSTVRTSNETKIYLHSGGKIIVDGGLIIVTGTPENAVINYPDDSTKTVPGGTVIRVNPDGSIYIISSLLTGITGLSFEQDGNSDYIFVNEPGITGDGKGNFFLTYYGNSDTLTVYGVEYRLENMPESAILEIEVEKGGVKTPLYVDIPVKEPDIYRSFGNTVFSHGDDSVYQIRVNGDFVGTFKLLYMNEANTIPLSIDQNFRSGSYYFAPLSLPACTSGNRCEIVKRPDTLGGRAPLINTNGQFTFANQVMSYNISRTGEYIVLATDGNGKFVEAYRITVE